MVDTSLYYILVEYVTNEAVPPSLVYDFNTFYVFSLTFCFQFQNYFVMTNENSTIYNKGSYLLPLHIHELSLK